ATSCGREPAGTANVRASHVPPSTSAPAEGAVNAVVAVVAGAERTLGTLSDEQPATDNGSTTPNHAHANRRTVLTVRRGSSGFATRYVYM
ncbi:MAG: hypothetical protein LC792_01005, partial [Actinobacteria bacterium]|nr:hypothetical protein [Actinomycetota bacterium]